MEIVGEVAGEAGELAGGNGAGLARLGEDDRGGVREKQAGDFVHGFIAHGAIDKNDAAVRKFLLPEAEKLAGAGGVVGAVEEEGGAVVKAFEAAGPDGGGDAAFNGLVGDR